jgi:helix-turn-helix protein
MKPGDLVRQAPNVFADREVGGKKMLVLRVDKWHAGQPNTTVVTLLDGTERTWNYSELELCHEAR